SAAHSKTVRAGTSSMTSNAIVPSRSITPAALRRAWWPRGRRTSGTSARISGPTTEGGLCPPGSTNRLNNAPARPRRLARPLRRVRLGPRREVLHLQGGDQAERGSLDGGRGSGGPREGHQASGRVARAHRGPAAG